MKSTTTLLIIFLFYILGFLSHALYLKKTVYGDGIYYYAWLRSVVIDHDIDFTNDYALLGGMQPKTSIGTIGNKYSIGPALLWTPAYVMTHFIVRSNGTSLPYQLVVGMTSVGLSLIGLLLLWQLLNRFFNDRVSIMTTTAIAGATNLLFYGSLDAVNSHALSFFTVTLFLYYVLMKKSLNFFLVGILLGLIGIIRMQDLIVSIVLIPYVRLTTVPKILFGLIVALIPQLLAWQMLYGNFWINPYLSGSEGFNLLNLHILGVLFSSMNGLFLWTPTVFFGFIGLVFFHPRGGGAFTSGVLRRTLIGIFIAQLVVISGWSTWWQGASFSGRMFVGTLPILSFGIATIFSRLERYRWAMVGILSSINALSIIYFLITLH